MLLKTSESCELSGQGIMIYLNGWGFFLRVFHQITYSLCSDTRYGGPEVTFSHCDFYKVNEIVFKPFLFDFSKVERVLCSSLCCSTLVKSNEFCVQAFPCSTLVKSNEICVQAFAVLFDISKVERVLCSSHSCSTLVKSNEFCVQAFPVRLL